MKGAMIGMGGEHVEQKEIEAGWSLFTQTKIKDLSGTYKDPCNPFPNLLHLRHNVTVSLRTIITKKYWSKANKKKTKMRIVRQITLDSELET